MLFVLIVGCVDDPLTAMGLAPQITVQVPQEQLEIPTTAPASGEDLAGGGEQEVAQDAAPAEPAPPPVKFDPISVPLGPREGSVKWEGVSRKGEGRVIDFGNGERGDPGLGR